MSKKIFKLNMNLLSSQLLFSAFSGGKPKTLEEQLLVFNINIAYQ
jgi:hypothetical protein